MTPARFRWGMLFILVGTLMLLAEADVLSLDFLLELGLLFPFLLIAIGIEKIFARTRLKALSYLSSVLLVAGALWVAFETSSYSSDYNFIDSGSLSYEVEDEPVNSLSVDLKLGNANLEVRSPSEDLLRARFGEWSLKPRSNMEVVNGVAEISLTERSMKRRFGGGTIGIDTGDDDEWQVRFAKNVPLSLKCRGSYNDVHLSLASNPVRDIDLDLDDADIYVKLGCLESEVQCSIAGDDSKLKLRVPEDAGLQISGLNDPDYLEEIGLVGMDSVFVTNNYDSVSCHIQVELDDRFRSLSIIFY